MGKDNFEYPQKLQQWSIWEQSNLIEKIHTAIVSDRAEGFF